MNKKMGFIFSRCFSLPLLLPRLQVLRVRRQARLSLVDVRFGAQEDGATAWWFVGFDRDREREEKEKEKGVSFLQKSNKKSEKKRMKNRQGKKSLSLSRTVVARRHQVEDVDSRARDRSPSRGGDDPGLF